MPNLMKQRRALFAAKKRPRKGKEQRLPGTSAKPGTLNNGTQSTGVNHVGGNGDGTGTGKGSSGGEGGGYRPVRNLVQARRKAKSLGIATAEIPDLNSLDHLHFEEYLSILNFVLEPLWRLREQGGRLPGQLIVSADLFSAEEFQATVARFSPGDDALQVNPDWGLWNPGLLQLAFARTPRDTSTPHPQGITFHEAAHWLIYHHSPILYNLLHDPTSEIYRADVNQYAPAVSIYAGENALEFIAEVYAAMQTGIPLPLEVIKAYRSMLGTLVLPGEQS